MADERELRASSDQMLAMTERLAELEHGKRGLPVGSPEFVAASTEIERLARIVFRWAQVELQLAHESTATAVSKPTLSEITPRRLDTILAAWREAQLRLEAARPGSPEAAAAVADVERLRLEYQAAQQAKLED